MEIENKFTIPEGSKVKFELHGVGSDYIVKTAEAYRDIEVLSGAILLIEGCLYCTDNIKPVEKINDTEFKIIVWIQDAFMVEGDYLYNSISDAD